MWIVLYDFNRDYRGNRFFVRNKPFTAGREGELYLGWTKRQKNKMLANKDQKCNAMDKIFSDTLKYNGISSQLIKPQH